MNATADLARRVLYADPAGVWAAPGRVNLIGEHTDYNGGLVLPFALAERTEAAISIRDDGMLRACSAQEQAQVVEIDVGSLKPGHPSGWGSYVAGVPWALGAQTGFDIAVSSEVPVGSGLSSSAALICAIALGINDLLDLGLDRHELAQRTRRAENDYVGAPTGGMDQMASLMCTAGHALLYDTAAGTTKQVPFDPGAAGLAILVVDTRVRHAHAGGEYASRRADCEAAVRQLGIGSLREIEYPDLERALRHIDDDRVGRRVRHVVTENHRVVQMTAALAAGEWEQVGALLVAAHRSIRDDFEASCPELDLAVDTMIDSGALGARMTGGGFGGAALGLMSIDLVEHAQARLSSAFATSEFTRPNTFIVAPSDGARRIV